MTARYESLGEKLPDAHRPPTLSGSGMRRSCPVLVFVTCTAQRRQSGARQVFAVEPLPRRPEATPAPFRAADHPERLALHLGLVRVLQRGTTEPHGLIQAAGVEKHADAFPSGELAGSFVLFERRGKFRVFAQKAIARMHRLGAGLLAGLDDAVDAQIALGRWRRPV